MREMEDGAGARNEGTQLCSVRAGKGLFGIDTRDIREVLGNAQPRRVPLAPAGIAGVLAYRGEMLTAVALRSLLGLEDGAERKCVLVLEDSERNDPFGLIVDEVGGVVTAAQGLMEDNPATLDVREMALFDGVFRTEAGLMARLNTKQLRPLEAMRHAAFRSQGVTK